MKVKLTKPLRHKGAELRELDVDVEGLTGRDLLDVEQEIFRSGKILVMADFAKVYLIRVAARAARIPVEVLEQLPARDFNAVTNEVQAFLTGSGSETSETAQDGAPEPAPATSSAG